MTSKLFLLALTAPLYAGEITIKTAPFRIEQTFTATAIPRDPTLISLDVDSWKEFKIETILEHGSVVKKGDVLFSFERESYDNKLADQTRDVEIKRIAVQTAEKELIKLKADTQIKLAEATRKKKLAEDDLNYFETVSRPAQEADLEQGLKRAEFGLESIQEELNQLQQMYQEDDLTEETEEIILKRQKIYVERAKYSLSGVKRKNARTLSSTLPRKHHDLKRAVENATIQLAKDQTVLPSLVKRAEIELTTKKDYLERNILKLKRITQDGKYLTITAPIDGTFLYGSLEHNKWTLGDLIKVLKKGRNAPTNKTIASISPTGAQLPLSSYVDYSQGIKLKDQSPVVVTLNGSNYMHLNAKISNPFSIPDVSGKDALTIDVAWPDGVNISPTQKLQCTAVIYEKDNTISIPSKALQMAADGSWTVEVKQDKERVRQLVERGRLSKGKVEILGGLEVGQIIIVPD